MAGRRTGHTCPTYVRYKRRQKESLILSWSRGLREASYWLQRYGSGSPAVCRMEDTDHQRLRPNGSFQKVSVLARFCHRINIAARRMQLETCRARDRKAGIANRRRVSFLMPFQMWRGLLVETFYHGNFAIGDSLDLPRFKASKRSISIRSCQDKMLKWDPCSLATTREATWGHTQPAI